jgi:diguanylate cyclase (GGDEF)-like protein/PAS domain S-box-containing protein
VESFAIGELQADGDLLIRAALGPEDGVAADHRVDGGQSSQAGYALLAGRPVVCEDLGTEAGARRSLVPGRDQPGGSVSIAIGPGEDPWGALTVSTGRHRRFFHDEVVFLQSVANVIGAAVQRQQAEQALRVSEELFRGGFDHSPIGMTLSNLDATLSRVNAAFARMIGYERPEQLVGLASASITHPEDRLYTRSAVDSMLETRQPHVWEKRYIRTDGAVVHARVASTVVRDANGEVSMVFSQVEDITVRKVAEAAQARLAAIVESSVDAIFTLTCDGVIETWNPAAERLFGYSAAQAIGQSRDLLSAPGSTVDSSDQALAGQTTRHEGQAMRRDGSVFEVGATLSPIRSGAEIVGVTCIMQDISGRKIAERELQRLADAAEHGTDTIVSIDLEQRVRHWNRGAERLYGFSAEEAIGRPVGELNGFTIGYQEANARIQDSITMVLGGEAVRQAETRRRRKNGTVVDVLNTLTPWRRDGRVVGVTAVGIDISERKQLELRLQNLADHDPLTGIFNRRRMVEELDRQLRYADRSRRTGAVLTLDLDHFKLANDTYGHATGDAILKAVATGLLSRTRDTDVVARMGGDEFTLILPEATEDQAVLVARDLRTLFGEQQTGRPIVISVGIALFLAEQEFTADEILACADTALYEAKEHGGDQVRVYSGQASGALKWVQRIRTALAGDCFALYGQPILDLRSGQATHQELLIRMISESGAMIAPAQFIPTAERFGLIQEIDRWVTSHGLRLALGGQRVAINLSGQSIGEQPIIAAVRAALAQGLEPANVIFEITETAALSDITAAGLFAQALTGLGCSVTLDDSGTGFGSFNYLKDISATSLKIDIEFVRNLATSETDRQIVKAIIAIAHSLDKLTIAEGVEDADTLMSLREYGVDQVQGFHIGKPQRIVFQPT